MSEREDLDSIYQLSVDDNKDLTEKQKQIIAAAIQTFSEKGFSASSTSEIAKKAGVAEGTIFRHYNTKKDLLLSIVTPVMSRLVAPFIINDVKKVLHKDYPSFEDFLRALLENRLAFARDNLPILKIMLQEIPFHPDVKEAFKKHVGEKVFDRIKEVVEHFQEKGEIVAWPSSTIIRLVASSGIGFILSRYLILPENERDDEAEFELTIAFIMRALRKNEQ